MTCTSVAILGGGIMGCSLAIAFARRGVRAVVFEAEDRLFAGASRWNEGKIHLGYMYNADASLNTARKVLPGGLLFKPLLEDLIETEIGDVTTREDDLYLCHKDSVVTPEAMTAYFQQVTELVQQHPGAAGYLADLRHARHARLGREELAQITDSPSLVAGFRIPERSVATTWIADRFAEAVGANARIELRLGTPVTGVEPQAAAGGGRWQVVTPGGRDGPFDCVVNALWHGRLAVDRTVPLATPREWSHRYRLAMFLRTRSPAAIPSAVIATGPFGDIKNYDGRNFYLSWYPAGLRAEGSGITPPAVPSLDAGDERKVAAAIFSALGGFFPGVRALAQDVERMTIAGGWVYAAGSGSLSNPQASLHRREDFGITRKGSYLSVDTGKYSTAPWLARTLVNDVLGAP